MLQKWHDPHISGAGGRMLGLCFANPNPIGRRWAVAAEAAVTAAAATVAAAVAAAVASSEAVALAGLHPNGRGSWAWPGRGRRYDWASPSQLGLCIHDEKDLPSTKWQKVTKKTDLHAEQTACRII